VQSNWTVDMLQATFEEQDGNKRRIPSSGKRRRVALVRTYVWEERIVSIIGMKRISELGTTLTVFLRSLLPLLVTANVVAR
jgi:hypothetical protein